MRRRHGLLLVALVLGLLGLRLALTETGTADMPPDLRPSNPGSPPSATKPAEAPGVEEAGTEDELVPWTERERGRLVTLTGRSRDAVTGEPIAAARIAGQDLHRSGFCFGGVTGPEILGSRRVEAIAAKDGRFRIEVSMEDSILVVDAAGYGTARFSIASTTDPVDLELVPAGSLVGRVARHDGRPVAGALVIASSPVPWFGVDVETPGHATVNGSLNIGRSGPTRTVRSVLTCAWTRTDEEGRYTLDRLSVAQEYELRAEFEGTPGSRFHHGILLAPGESREIALHVYQGAALALRVRDESGHATKGARLWLIPAERGLLVKHGESDERGRILTEAILPGAYRGMLKVQWAEDEIFEITFADGETVSREIVHGPVEPPRDEPEPRNEPEPRPAGRATVRMSLEFPPDVDPPGWIPAMLEREGFGQSASPRIDGGRLVIATDARFERLVLSPPGLLEQTVPLDLRPGEDRTLPTVRFSRGASIEVLVTHPDGSPFPGATVGLERREGCRGTTDPTGRAVLHGFRPDETITLVVTAAGFAEESRETRPGTLTVALRRLGVLRGRFVDEHGLPFAHLDAILHRRLEDGSEWREAALTSDNAGRFERHLPPGHYRLEIRPRTARERVKAADPEVVVRPGDNAPVRLRIPR